ncbi:MAG: ABC transporter substrate-binding protein [Oscillatoriales cyanobacterium SM2_1_8]|nr:ABC transporter substrate-binding protein [Oscillatoriales cyanobacterium SM2_1_8]
MGRRWVWMLAILGWAGALPAAAQGGIESRISRGERLLIAGEANNDKRQATAAIGAREFAQAVARLTASLQRSPDDPEARIYLNNARIGTGRSHGLAVSVPIGTNLTIAQEILRGVSQAQQTINQGGGINGVPLRVTIANDDNAPKIVEEIAGALVRDGSVLAVVGHNSSTASLAGAPVYQGGKLVMVSPTSDSLKLSDAGSFIFRTLPPIGDQGRALASHAVQTKRGRVVVCSAYNDTSAESFRQEFEKALTAAKGTVVPVRCDLSVQGFSHSAIAAQAKQQGAQAVLLAPSVQTIPLAVLTGAAAKGQQLAVLGSSTMGTLRLNTQGKDVEGMVIGVPWHPRTAANSPFMRTAENLWNGNVTWRSANAHDAVVAIAAALRRSPSRAGVQQSFASANFRADGVTGSVRFAKSGDRWGPTLLWCG